MWHDVKVTLTGAAVAVLMMVPAVAGASESRYATDTWNFSGAEIVTVSPRHSGIPRWAIVPFSRPWLATGCQTFLAEFPEVLGNVTPDLCVRTIATVSGLPLETEAEVYQIRNADRIPAGAMIMVPAPDLAAEEIVEQTRLHRQIHGLASSPMGMAELLMQHSSAIQQLNQRLIGVEEQVGELATAQEGLSAALADKVSQADYQALLARVDAGMSQEQFNRMLGEFLTEQGIETLAEMGEIRRVAQAAFESRLDSLEATQAEQGQVLSGLAAEFAQFQASQRTAEEMATAIVNAAADRLALMQPVAAEVDSNTLRAQVEEIVSELGLGVADANVQIELTAMQASIDALANAQGVDVEAALTQWLETAAADGSLSVLTDAVSEEVGQTADTAWNMAALALGLVALLAILGGIFVYRKGREGAELGQRVKTLEVQNGARVILPEGLLAELWKLQEGAIHTFEVGVTLGNTKYYVVEATGAKGGVTLKNVQDQTQVVKIENVSGALRRAAGAGRLTLPRAADKAAA